MNTLKAYNYPIQWAIGLQSLPENTCLISINDTIDPDVEFRFESEHIHKFRVNDLVYPMEYKGRDLKPIDVATAISMVDVMCKNNDKNFIVHCHAGVSRSAAVCLFAHIAFGHSLNPRFRDLSMPNALILGMLIRTYFLKPGDIHR